MVDEVAGQRELDDRRFKKLQDLIRRSFRVRENRTPVYVDVADHLDRVALDQHQIIFGRRGSGKSCLLIYFRRAVAPKSKVHTSYINADTIKTLDYPDVLIRLLLGIFEQLPSRRWWKRLVRRDRDVAEAIHGLRELLDLPLESTLTVTVAENSTSTDAANAGISQGSAQAGVSTTQSTGASREEVRQSQEQKVRTVEAACSTTSA